LTGIVRQHSVVGLDLPAQVAIQIARRVLATEGYQSVAVGPTAATFVRDVRPPLGISLLSALSRAQEQCTVSAETSRRGTALSLSGVVTTRTLQELEDSLRQESGKHPAAPITDDVQNRQSTPGRGAAAQRSAPPATPGSAPRLGDSGALRRNAAASRTDTGAFGKSRTDSGGLRPQSAPTPPPAAAKPSPPASAPPATPSLPARPKAPVWPVKPEQARQPLPPPPSLSAEDLLKRSPRPPDVPRPPVAAPPPAAARPPAVPRPPVVSLPPDEEMASDLTVVRGSPLALESASWAGAASQEPRWVIILDDGRTIDIPDFALIGRDPEPTEDDPEAGLVSLIDPEMSVSKTHASFGVDDEGLWFLDRYSTNGTSMQAPGGERVGLEPGVATPIPPGSEVWIGRRHLRIDRAED
jgi:hypothetical protein